MCRQPHFCCLTNGCLAMRLIASFTLQMKTADVKIDILSPHVVVFGNLFDKPEVYIYVDGQPILVAADPVDALLSVYQLYYCLWLHFPKCAVGCYKFIQTVGFNRTDGPVPAKLVRLMSEIK
jgi:hypothetical protein